ncbi:MAG: hypothetical protein HOP33_18895 [Verrucomicrobia bacterium]|nr:hypothetical protein [Verrucomicrobiota bacterium]
MKTTHTHITRRLEAATSPATPNPLSSPRPARSGHFWPGESFALFPRTHELASAMAGVSFVLPQIASGHFPK